MLVDEDGTVLLGDFGVGVYVGEGQGAGALDGKRKSFVGTVSACGGLNDSSSHLQILTRACLRPITPTKAMLDGT